MKRVIELDTGLDLLDLLESEDDGSCDPICDFVGRPGSEQSPPSSGCSPGQAGEAGISPPTAGLASVAVGSAGLSEVGREGAGVPGSLPDDLPFPEYVQRFKDTFIKARPLEEVGRYASAMAFRDWMDFVIKLLPKDVKIQGEVSFVHQLASLGPIDKDAYRLTAPDAVEAEFCEVSNG